MIPAILLSFVLASLSMLAFCLTARPNSWLRLWDPFRAAAEGYPLSRHERRMLPGVRIRSFLAGVILLIAAVFLPMLYVRLFLPGDGSLGSRSRMTVPASCSLPLPSMVPETHLSEPLEDAGPPFAKTTETRAGSYPMARRDAGRP